ncbi:7521_t:CDS:2 [Scutellospora calospora]|uniref:7521_t:CDS:1 n=1 Tax=Scutellospora calospora TaxID=85575 RepID=A0ACA9K754_9GLOM|nr:7521_t:CDS:2 [Scutellospora calospora]
MDIMDLQQAILRNNQQVLYRKKSGRPKAAAWVYFTKGSAADKYGHYSTTCVYCGQSWLRGKPKVMESHLAFTFNATYSHVYQLAIEIKKEIEIAKLGSNVEIFQIPKIFQEQVPDQVYAYKMPDIPFIDTKKLAEVDGILFGISTISGQFPTQFKAFLDSSSQHLEKGLLNNKFGGIFFSTDTQIDSQETVAFTAISWLSHQGINFVPLGNGSPYFGENEEMIGGPWGVNTITGNDVISEKEKEIAQFQGKKFAEIVTAYVKGRQEMAVTTRTVTENPTKTINEKIGKPFRKFLVGRKVQD